MRCRACEKPKVSCRKGLWSPEEDQKLRDHIIQHGLGCWSSIPAKAGLQRNGKSCRLRWINYLKPGLKRGIFTTQEEEIIISLHSKLGNKWSQMALHLPGRTDNEIKNYWNSYLKKKVIKLDFQGPKDSSNQALKVENFQLQPSNKISISAALMAHELSPGDQSGQSPSCSFNKGGLRSSFPKVLFAEWLSRDNHDGQNAPSLDHQSELNSSWEMLRSGEMAVNGLQQACGRFVHGFEERGIFEDLQSLNSDSGFADLLSVGNENIGDGDIIYDVMF